MDLEFSCKSQNFALNQDPLMNLMYMYIWHDGTYRSVVLLSTIPNPGCDLEVKVTDLEFSYKSQNVCI